MSVCKKILEKPSDDDLGALLWRVMKLWQRDRQKDLDEFNTTFSQLEILAAIFYINKEIGELTQIALSQETGIDPMTTSTILRNLEKKKLVIRKPSKTDTRARVVELTKSGEDLLANALTKIRKAQEELFSHIDADHVKFELKKLLVFLEKDKNI